MLLEVSIFLAIVLGVVFYRLSSELRQAQSQVLELQSNRSTAPGLNTSASLINSGIKSDAKAAVTKLVESASPPKRTERSRSIASHRAVSPTSALSPAGTSRASARSTRSNTVNLADSLSAISAISGGPMQFDSISISSPSMTPSVIAQGVDDADSVLSDVSQTSHVIEEPQTGHLHYAEGEEGDAGDFDDHTHHDHESEYVSSEHLQLNGTVRHSRRSIDAQSDALSISELAAHSHMNGTHYLDQQRAAAREDARTTQPSPTNASTIAMVAPAVSFSAPVTFSAPVSVSTGMSPLAIPLHLDLSTSSISHSPQHDNGLSNEVGAHSNESPSRSSHTLSQYEEDLQNIMEAQRRTRREIAQSLEEMEMDRSSNISSHLPLTPARRSNPHYDYFVEAEHVGLDNPSISSIAPVDQTNLENVKEVYGSEFGSNVDTESSAYRAYLTENDLNADLQHQQQLLLQEQQELIDETTHELPHNKSRSPSVPQISTHSLMFPGASSFDNGSQFSGFQSVDNLQQLRESSLPHPTEPTYIKDTAVSAVFASLWNGLPHILPPLTTEEEMDRDYRNKEAAIEREFRGQTEHHNVALTLMREELRVLDERYAHLQNQIKDVKKQRAKARAEVDAEMKVEIAENTRVSKIAAVRGIPTTGLIVQTSPLKKSPSKPQQHQPAALTPIKFLQQQQHLAKQDQRTTMSPVLARTEQKYRNWPTPAIQSPQQSSLSQSIYNETATSPAKHVSVKVNDFLRRQEKDIVGRRDRTERFQSHEYSPFKFRNASPEGPPRSPRAGSMSPRITSLRRAKSVSILGRSSPSAENPSSPSPLTRNRSEVLSRSPYLALLDEPARQLDALLAADSPRLFAQSLSPTQLAEM